MNKIAKEMRELADEPIVTAPEGRALLRKGADEIERLRSIAVDRMDLFKQAASKVEQADTLLLAFVAAYQQQDADNFTDAMRNVYAAADLFVSGDAVSSQKEPS